MDQSLKMTANYVKKAMPVIIRVSSITNFINKSMHVVRVTPALQAHNKRFLAVRGITKTKRNKAFAKCVLHKKNAIKVITSMEQIVFQANSVI